MVQEPTSGEAGDGRHLDFHPGMGMRWEITRSTEDTSGAVFEAKNWLDPRMPGPPIHVHPGWAESFEVIEGSLDVCQGGKWTTLGPGEKATVPAGEPHTLRNGSDLPVTTVTTIEPAQESEQLFRGLHRLIREGKIKHLPPKEPRSAIYAAMLFTAYPDEIRVTGPLGGVFKALAVVGKMLRFKL